MQIDWLTVAAQIVNFLALVWLLQRFLYRPITEAMRRREERIEKRLATAKAAADDAERQAQQLRDQQRQLDEAQADILEKAKAKAAQMRKSLEAGLRQDMEARRQTWHDQLDAERDDFARMLQRQAGRQLLDITAQVLAEFAGKDLAASIADTFLSRLAALDKQTRQKLADAAAHAQTAIVDTGQPLTSATRSKITRALHKIVSSEIPVEYRKNAAVLLGVRLTIGEQTLEWSAARHLKRLEKSLDEILESRSHRHTASQDTQIGNGSAKAARPAR